jgi:hypothetical protein
VSVWCGDAEPAAVYHETFPRARKFHTCEACRETVFPGQKYCRVSIVWEGTVTDYKRCMRCQRLHEHLREVLAKVSDGECWPDETLDCGHSYQDMHGKEPPPEIAALAFALPGETL